MIRITVRPGGGPATTHSFAQDVVSIGRSRENDLALTDDALSRFHALVRRGPDGWLISDRGSRNGTILNGKTVDGETGLTTGDHVTLGDTVLAVEIPTAGARRAADSARETDTATAGMGARRATPVDGAGLLVGSSPRIREVIDTIAKVAPSDATVLITGETGTGKELAARLLHERSSRRAAPFVVINCPVLPGTLVESELFGVEPGVATGVQARPGKIEQAAGGTLLLDEIGDMDLGAQAKLLRFLQERNFERVGGRKTIPVDVRVLAATHHDLAADAKRGTFRADLFHRLNTICLEMPPLRERREDVPALIEHFLAKLGAERAVVSPEALDALLAHDYPGNVRELGALVERARLLTPVGAPIALGALPASLRAGRAEVPREIPEEAAVAAALFHRIVHGRESFWDVVQGPYLRRELSREAVRSLVAVAHAQGGGTYKGMAALFRIESQHKKLLNFLRNHELGVREGG